MRVHVPFSFLTFQEEKMISPGLLLPGHNVAGHYLQVEQGQLDIVYEVASLSFRLR